MLTEAQLLERVRECAVAMAATCVHGVCAAGVQLRLPFASHAASPDACAYVAAVDGVPMLAPTVARDTGPADVQQLVPLLETLILTAAAARIGNSPLAASRQADAAFLALLAARYAPWKGQRIMRAPVVGTTVDLRDWCDAHGQHFVESLNGAEAFLGNVRVQPAHAAAATLMSYITHARAVRDLSTVVTPSDAFDIIALRRMKPAALATLSAQLTTARAHAEVASAPCCRVVSSAPARDMPGVFNTLCVSCVLTPGGIIALAHMGSVRDPAVFERYMAPEPASAVDTYMGIEWVTSYTAPRRLWVVVALPSMPLWYRVLRDALVRCGVYVVPANGNAGMQLTLLVSKLPAAPDAVGTSGHGARATFLRMAAALCLGNVDEVAADAYVGCRVDGAACARAQN